MDKEKWLDGTGVWDYRFSLEVEITAAGLLFAEVCRLPPDRRRCFMERFVEDDDGDIKVDYEILLRELCRIAAEAGNEIEDMERRAGKGLTRGQLVEARVQLLKENFALLKNNKNPDFMRFLADLYQTV